MDFELNGKIKLDTQQAKQDFNSFIGSMNSYPSMTNGNATPSMMAGAQYQNSTEKANLLNDSFGNLQDEVKKVLESFKSLCTVLDDTANKAGVDFSKIRKDQQSGYSNPSNVPSAPSNNKGGMPVPANQVRSVVGVLDTGSNMVSSVANGDAAGAFLTGQSSAGNLALSGAGTAAAAGATAAAGPLAIIGGLLLGGAAIGKGELALASKYEDAMPGMDSLLRTFGGDNIGNNAEEVNSRLGMLYRNQILEKNVGTGLTNEEFVKLTSSLGSYGITNMDRASDIAKLGASIGSFTGVDPNKVTSFGGLVERYGGNATDSMRYALKAAQTSGLDKSQFGEFLDGLQRVVETGISKGFVQSTEEVANNLGMLSTLSDKNPLWMGKEGANRYQTMMNTASSKTDLMSTTSILMARAANDLGSDFIKNQLGTGGSIDGDSVLNTLAYMEKGGMDYKFMEKYRDRLNNAYGADTESKVAALKESYGLNWEGSIQLYNMMNKIGTNGYTEDDFKKEVSDITTNPDYKSDNKQMIETLNQIDKDVVAIGKPMHDIKIDALDDITPLLRSITSILAGERYQGVIKGNVKNLFGAFESNAKKEFSNKAMEDLMSGDPEKVQNVIDMFNWIENADTGTLDYYNYTNTPMDLFDPSKRVLHAGYGRDGIMTQSTSPEGVYDDNRPNDMDVFAFEEEFAIRGGYNPDYNTNVTTEGERAVGQLLTDVKNHPEDFNMDLNEVKEKARLIANQYQINPTDSDRGRAFDSNGLKEAIDELRAEIEINTMATNNNTNTGVTVMQYSDNDSQMITSGGTRHYIPRPR